MPTTNAATTTTGGESPSASRPIAALDAANIVAATYGAKNRSTSSPVARRPTSIAAPKTEAAARATCRPVTPASIIGTRCSAVELIAPASAKNPITSAQKLGWRTATLTDRPVAAASGKSVAVDFAAYGFSCTNQNTAGTATSRTAAPSAA